MTIGVIINRSCTRACSMGDCDACVGWLYRYRGSKPREAYRSDCTHACHIGQDQTTLEFDDPSDMTKEDL